MSYKNEAQGSTTQPGVVKYHKGKRGAPSSKADAAPSYSVSSDKPTESRGSSTSEGAVKTYKWSGKGVEQPTERWGLTRSKKA